MIGERLDRENLINGGMSKTVTMMTRPLPPPLPGWRRYYCRAQHCRYMYEAPAIPGSSAPGGCRNCGRPWVAISETVGNRQGVPDVREM